MALSDRARSLLELILRGEELMMSGDCPDVPKRAYELLCLRRGELATMQGVPLLTEEGLYNFRYGNLANTWGHHVTVAYVGGDALILQAWVNTFTLSDWLGESDPHMDGEHLQVFQAARTAFSPTGAGYINDPDRQYKAFTVLLDRALRTFNPGGAEQSAEAWAAACGVVDKTVAQRCLHGLGLSVQYGAFNPTIAGALRGTEHKTVVAPAAKARCCAMM